MQAKTVKAWSFIHKWTSLACTVFLLMLCLTGLPLIFHDEIDAALNPPSWQPENPSAARLSFDQILNAALNEHKGAVPLYMSFDIDRPVVNVTTGPRVGVPDTQMTFRSFDATSGTVVPAADRGETVMEFIYQLHVDMLLGLPGMLFLGFVGFLFVLAIVSGVVLYAPFMKRLDFAAVRSTGSTRLKWLDLHNLLGIVTTAWVLVVGLTGIINTLETPILEAWKAQDLKDLIAENQATAAAQRQGLPRASLDAAIRQAVAAVPNMTLQFVAFPGSSYSTSAHYAIFLHGKTPVTQHIVTPVLVNAATGDFVGLREMPWYSKALSLSRPLHFGDYAGLPLKLIWAALDIVTIIVLGSGLYLWLCKRPSNPRSR